MTQFYKTINGLNGIVGNDLAFTPTDIANCKLWLEADKGITLDTGVSVWADQSGNGNNFSQGTGAYQPGYTVQLNGKYVLSATGTEYLTSSWTPNDTAHTVYAVARDTRADGDLAGAVDTIFSTTDTDFGGIRFELYNYYDNPDIRQVYPSASAVGDVYKNGWFTDLKYSDLFLAENEWALMTAIFSTVSGQQAAEIFNNVFGLKAQADLAAIIIYEGEHNETQRKQVEQYLALRWGQQHRDVAKRSIICAGDSLTEGYPLYVAGSWPYLLWNDWGQNNGFYMHNVAVTGITSENVDAHASDPGGIDTYPFSDESIKYLVLWCGTNDMYSEFETPATTYSRIRTLIQNRKATGVYDYILFGNCIPRGGSGTDFSDLNTLLSTNFSTLQSDGLDVLVDIAANSEFDEATDSNNTTYYQVDKIHLTVAGETIIKNTFKSAIEGLF